MIDLLKEKLHIKEPTFEEYIHKKYKKDFKRFDLINSVEAFEKEMANLLDEYCLLRAKNPKKRTRREFKWLKRQAWFFFVGFGAVVSLSIGVIGKACTEIINSSVGSHIDFPMMPVIFGGLLLTAIGTVAFPFVYDKVMEHHTRKISKKQDEIRYLARDLKARKEKMFPQKINKKDRKNRKNYKIKLIEDDFIL